MIPETYRALEILKRSFIFFTMVIISAVPGICLDNDISMTEKSNIKEMENLSVKPPDKSMEINGVIKPLMDDIPDWKAMWEMARLLSYIKEYDEAVFYYRKVMDEMPERYEIREELARVLFWSGNNKEAMKAMREIPEKNLKKESLLIYGDLFAFDKNYDKAAEYYRKYLIQKPENIDVMLRLAEVLSWSEKYDESIEAFKKVLKARPDDIQVRRKYALVLSWTKKYKEAVEQLRKTFP